MKRIFEIIRNPTNAAIIADEVRRALDKYGRQGHESAMPEGPYTLYLVGQAWDIDLHTSGKTESDGTYAMEDLGSVFDPVPCDTDMKTTMKILDSWAVIDVTDPMIPGCGFMPWTSRAVIHQGPLDAKDYYGSLTGIESSEITETALTAIVGSRPITVRNLAEAWPAVFSPLNPEANVVPDPLRATEAVPSLLELTSAALVEQVAKSPSALPGIIERLDLTSKKDDTPKVLRSMPIIPDAMLPTLIQVLCYDPAVEDHQFL